VNKTFSRLKERSVADDYQSGATEPRECTYLLHEPQGTPIIMDDTPVKSIDGIFMLLCRTFHVSTTHAWGNGK
jgi:hypothetical protein